MLITEKVGVFIGGRLSAAEPLKTLLPTSLPEIAPLTSKIEKGSMHQSARESTFLHRQSMK